MTADSENVLQFDYEAAPDEDGIYDGRALAREMIADAYKLLVPYGDGCRARVDDLFMALVNEEIAGIYAEAARSGHVPNVILGAGEGEGSNLDERMSRHKERTKSVTTMLLDKAAACGGDHGHR